MHPDSERASLKSILPRDEICRCFDRELHFNEYSLRDLNMVAKQKPHILSGLALRVWNRNGQPGEIPAYHGGMHDLLSWESPAVHQEVSTIIGAEIIRDLYYVTAVVNDSLLRDLRVTELFVALVYPNSLYIADFDFSMMPRILPNAGSLFPSQWYLGILNKMIDNAIAYSTTQGCDHLLMNARRSQFIDCFLKRGFVLEDPKTEIHVIRLGLGIPMVRQLQL